MRIALIADTFPPLRTSGAVSERYFSASAIANDCAFIAVSSKTRRV